MNLSYFDNFNISSINYNCNSTKIDSLFSENIIKNKLSEDLASLKGNNTKIDSNNKLDDYDNYDDEYYYF